jgi:hypothetical protein
LSIDIVDWSVTTEVVRALDSQNGNGQTLR